jgi:hypothetical protein
MEQWLDFYTPFFNTQKEAIKFINSCEAQTYPNNTAKIMMHQVKRLISLSDDLQKIHPNEDPLKLLILIICVENIAKLFDEYTDEGKSKYYVSKFFKEFLSSTDKNLLQEGFINNKDLDYLGFEETITLFYKIRCDVVHEGNYVSFSFYDGKNDMLEIVNNYEVIPHISLEVFRAIIIRGCINAIEKKL